MHFLKSEPRIFGADPMNSLLPHPVLVTFNFNTLLERTGLYSFVSELVNVCVMRHVYDIESFARNRPSSFVTISIVWSGLSQFAAENTMLSPFETLQRGSLEAVDKVTVILAVVDGYSPFIFTV